MRCLRTKMLINADEERKKRSRNASRNRHGFCTKLCEIVVWMNKNSMIISEIAIEDMEEGDPAL